VPCERRGVFEPFGKHEKRDRDHCQNVAALDKERLTSALQSDDDILANRLESIKRLAAAGEMGADEEYAQQRQLTLEVREEELSRLDDELSMLTRGTAEYDKALQERRKLSEKFTKDVAKLDDDHRAKVTASVTSTTQMMTKPFATAIQEMTDGTKTFANSMKGLFVGMAESFTQMVAEMVDKWAIGQIANAVITSETGIAEISTHAGVGAAAAASSQAGIPIVGPVLAIAAATAMEGFILGLGSLAHASGGMTLDRDQLVYAHAKEMILPAHISQGLQSMIAAGNTGGGGSGGNTTLHYSPTVHAPASATLDQMLQNESGAMRAWLMQSKRDGKL